MKTMTPVRLALLLVTLIVSCCSPDPAANVKKLADMARPALAADLIQIKTQYFAPDTNNLILLVGENHASVKTQKQLAELISRLLKANALDSILIEGSNGLVESGSLNQQLLGTGRTSEELAAYWQQQLDRGLVAGYEFVSLTQPALEVFGVEDMAAKARNAAFLSEDGLHKHAESTKRGVTVLDEAVAQLRPTTNALSISEIESEIAALRDATNEYGRAVEELIAKQAPIRELETEYATLQGELSPALHRLGAAQPSFKQYLDWSAQTEALVAPFRQRLAEIEALESLSRTASDFKRKKAQLELDLAQVEPQLDQLKSKITSFEAAHDSDLAIVNAKYERFSEVSKNLEAANKALGSNEEQVIGASARVENGFFIAANHVCDLGNKEGIPVPQVRMFFKNETDRLAKDQSTKIKDLAERDTAMAENTLKYLHSHANKKISLLVVGYAHVAGLEEKLKERNISFVSGKVAASDEPIEPWEEMAWSQRQQASQLVFASAPELKEISQLLNDNWKREQVAKLRFFSEMRPSVAELQPSIRGLAWDGRIYENIAGKEQSMRTGKFPFDPNADYGQYVVDRGPVPGKAGEFYEVIDRKIAATEVKRLSDADTSFVFYQRTRSADEAKATYVLKGPDGDQSVQDFVSKPPGVENVVLFGEADEVREGDVVVSPLWKKFRSGDGGQPPPKPPKRTVSGESPDGGGWWTSAFLALDQGKRPQLLRTINPARARRNLIGLKKQQAAFLGDIQFFEENDLPLLHQKLKFTPERGDNAQMVVLVGRNVPELRTAVREAAEARLLKGKQVALIVCGDSFGETAALRETLLREGALMVWTNDRQITVEAGFRLRDEVRKAAQSTKPEKRKTINKLMDRALRNWYQETPNDPNLRSFEQATAFVLIEYVPPTALSLS